MSVFPMAMISSSSEVSSLTNAAGSMPNRASISAIVCSVSSTTSCMMAATMIQSILWDCLYLATNDATRIGWIQ